jgi:hypothetical protein
MIGYTQMTSNVFPSTMPNTLGGGRVFGVHFERKQNDVLNPAEPASASTKSLNK